MIDEKIFENDINCKTKYAKNEKLNDGKTPLYLAICFNSIECVDALCKQSNVEITKQDVYKSLDNDKISILKILL